MQSIPILTLTHTASGTINAQRFVAQAGDQAAEGENTLGVARTGASDGDLIPVDVLGTTIVEAGDDVTVGASLMSDANGKAVPQTVGNAIAAVCLQAGGDGDLIEVLLMPNALAASE